MMLNPIEIKDVIRFQGERYAYWRLREISKVGRLKALYLIWVAKGVK